MTHLAEERNLTASPERIWAIVADSRRWPEFYHTHDGLGKLRAVEFLGKPVDGVGARRRMTFTLVPPWDEEIVRFEPPATRDEAERAKASDRQPGEAIVELRGVRNPGMKYWHVTMELVPGRSFTTLRWDLYFELARWSGLFGGKKRVKRVLEDVMLTGLLEIDRLASKTE
jgi:hypothetical protein